MSVLLIISLLSAANMVWTMNVTPSTPELCSTVSNSNSASSRKSIVCSCKLSKPEFLDSLVIGSFASELDVELFKLSNCNSVVINSGFLNGFKRLGVLELVDLGSLTITGGALSGSSRTSGLQLRVRGVSNLTVQPGAISGDAFKSIVFENNAWPLGVPTAMLSNLRLQELTFRGNEFRECISPLGIGDKVECATFTFDSNEVRKLASAAFNVKVLRSAIVSRNEFSVLLSDAFRFIKMSKYAANSSRLAFSANRINEYADGALMLSSFSSLSVDSLLVNKSCGCDPEADVDALMGSASLADSGFMAARLQLQTALTCRAESVFVKATEYRDANCDDERSGRAFAAVPDLCKHSSCVCNRTHVDCSCSRLLSNSTDSSILAIGFSLPPPKFQTSSFSFPKATSLSLSNCDAVAFNMGRLSFASQVRAVSFVNITTLTLAAATQRSPKDTTPTIDFAVANCSLDDSLAEGTFIAAFKSVLIRDAKMAYINRKAFSGLHNLSQVTLSSVTVERQINTEAFFDVSAELFEVVDSNIREIEASAFNVAVSRKLSLRNLAVTKMRELALVNITATAINSSLEISNLTLASFEPGALVVDWATAAEHLDMAELKIGLACRCDLYSLFTLDDHHESSAMDANVLCLSEKDAAAYERWTHFDEARCHGADGHRHLEFDGEGNLVIDRTALSVVCGIAIAVGLIVFLACVVCFRTRRVTVLPLLPIPEEEEEASNWMRASFERQDVGPRLELTPLTPTPDYHCVSTLSLAPDETIAHEAETLRRPFRYDRTLDVIQDAVLSRISLPARPMFRH